MTFAGVIPFPGITWTAIGFIAAILFVSYFVKGALGVGAMLPAVLFLTLIVGPHQAVLLAVLTNAVSHLQFLRSGLHDGDWNITRRVITGNFVGSVFGVWAFGELNSDWLVLLIGITLSCILVADMTNALGRLSKQIDLRSYSVIYPLSGAAGFISGITGAGGFFFITMYVRHVCPSPKSFRGTVILISMLVIGWRIILFSGSGFISSRLIVESAILAPPVVFGGLVGTWFYRKLPDAWFYRFYQGTIVFGIAGLAWKGLRDLF